MPAEKHIFADAQLGNEHEFLMNDVDAQIVSLVRGFNFDWLALPEKLSPVCFIEPGSDLHERGFSGAILADQSMDLAGPHIETDVFKHGDTAKGLGDVVHSQERFRVLHHQWCCPRPMGMFYFLFILFSIFYF